MFNVTKENFAYHLSDVPPVLLLGLIGGLLGALYNFILEKVLRLYSFINGLVNAFAYQQVNYNSIQENEFGVLAV